MSMRLLCYETMMHSRLSSSVVYICSGPRMSCVCILIAANLLVLVALRHHAKATDEQRQSAVRAPRIHRGPIMLQGAQDWSGTDLAKPLAFHLQQWINPWILSVVEWEHQPFAVKPHDWQRFQRAQTVTFQQLQRRWCVHTWWCLYGRKHEEPFDDVEDHLRCPGYAARDPDVDTLKKRFRTGNGKSRCRRAPPVCFLTMQHG
mmetsp:Transcript_24238/g.78979  ORF Transcript_24238/g.78979 Transcript_24238/m.78979 type:complete len:203 (+) Transcript_24238:206-814(+)